MPRIVAHRGLWYLNHAENSLAAFQAAARQGFACECDVWPTADGQPVIMHDPTVDRTTDGHGAITSFRADQLATLALRIAPQWPITFGPPPLLEDVADLMHLVEIKPADAPELVHRVIEIMGSRRWLLQSSDPANIRHALALRSDLAIALLADDEDAVELGIANGWAIYLNHALLDNRIAGAIRDRGLRMGVWTVNEEAEILRVLQWLPDVIISDQALTVRHVFRKSGLPEE